MSEKVWRGIAFWVPKACGYYEKGWRKSAMSDLMAFQTGNTEELHAAPFEEKTEVVALPAADYDALQARMADSENTHEHERESWRLGVCNLRDQLDAAKRRIATLEAELAEKTAECAKSIDSIRECRMFLRGCMNHAFDETPIVEVAKDVSQEFHRNRYQISCVAKERDNITKERDAANLLLRRLMCVVVPDNVVPNDMKEFVRDSAATVLKDLWDYLKTDADLRMAKHGAK